MSAYGELLVGAGLPGRRSVVDKIFGRGDVCLAWREPAPDDGNLRKSLHELAANDGIPPRRLPIRPHFLREGTCNIHQRKRQKQKIAVTLPDVDANAICREVP